MVLPAYTPSFIHGFSIELVYFFLYAYFCTPMQSTVGEHQLVLYPTCYAFHQLCIMLIMLYSLNDTYFNNRT
jgi:hypothetical protein